MPLLERISRGKLRTPIRLVVHGPGGIGKTTFASNARRPVILDVEDRSSHLNVARFKPADWVECINFLNEVKSSPDFDTVIIDTLDHLELMLHSYLCTQYKASNINMVAGGYGKGFAIALDEFRRFVVKLDELRAAGKDVILLAHSQIRTFKNPAGEDYDMWSMKLHEKTSAYIREKADAVGFAAWDDVGKKAQGASKAKAITSGDRELRFGHNPAFESKAGFDLPDTMDLDWAEFQKAVDKFYAQESK